MLNSVGWYWDNGSLKAYCWWKKSCTIVDIKTIPVFSRGFVYLKSCRISSINSMFEAANCSCQCLLNHWLLWVTWRGKHTNTKGQWYTRLVVELISAFPPVTQPNRNQFLLAPHEPPSKHFGRSWQDFAFNWKLLQCFRITSLLLVIVGLFVVVWSGWSLVLASIWCFCSLGQLVALVEQCAVAWEGGTKSWIDDWWWLTHA